MKNFHFGVNCISKCLGVSHESLWECELWKLFFVLVGLPDGFASVITQFKTTLRANNEESVCLFKVRPKDALKPYNISLWCDRDLLWENWEFLDAVVSTFIFRRENMLIFKYFSYIFITSCIVKIDVKGFSD